MTAQKLIPRQPTDEERAQMEAILRPHTYSEAEAKVDVAHAAIAVFDDCATKGPGYRGKAMLVLWSADLTFYEVFIWRDGVLIHVEQEQAMRREQWKREQVW